MLHAHIPAVQTQLHRFKQEKLNLGSPVWVVVEHVETVQQHIAGPQNLKATNHNTVDPTAI